jgi:hypothetical protein
LARRKTPNDFSHKEAQKLKIGATRFELLCFFVAKTFDAKLSCGEFTKRP